MELGSSSLFGMANMACLEQGWCAILGGSHCKQREHFHPRSVLYGYELVSASLMALTPKKEGTMEMVVESAELPRKRSFCMVHGHAIVEKGAG